MLILTLPTEAQAQFSYTTNNGAITITGYNGSGAVNIPSATNGFPVTGIGFEAFNHPDLTNVTIPSSVNNIATSAFILCSSLQTINVDSNNPFYCSVNGALFDKQQTTLLQCPDGLVGSYTIPPSVTNIIYLFYYCTLLTAINADSNNLVYGSVNGVLFDKKQTTLIECPDGATGSYTLPSSVTSFRASGFNDC
jgi:hypothetical protein